jgi:hypothetical protein
MKYLKEFAAFGGLLFGILALATVGIKAQDWVEEAAQKSLGETVQQNCNRIRGIEQDVLQIKYMMKADSVTTQEKLDSILEAVTDD